MLRSVPLPPSDYYQWVSLVLAMQAIMCYLPRLIWEVITFNRVGTNLGFLIESAQSASKETGQTRAKHVQFVASVIDTLLFARRRFTHAPALGPNGRVCTSRRVSPTYSVFFVITFRLFLVT